MKSILFTLLLSILFVACTKDESMEMFRQDMRTKWGQHYDQSYVLGTDSVLVVSFFQNGSANNPDALSQDAKDKARYAIRIYKGEKAVNAVQIEYRVPDIRSITMEATAMKFRFLTTELHH